MTAPTPANYGTAASPSSGSLPYDPTTGLITIWNTPTGVSSSDANAFWNTTLWYDTGTKTVPNEVSSGGGSSARSPGGPTFEDVGNPSGTHSTTFDQNMTAQDAMKQFAAMAADPHRAAQWQSVQALLQQGGWFGSATQVYGGFNGQSETALANAMLQYIKVSQGAGVGVSFTQFLQNTAQQNAANGGGAAGGSGSSAPILTDPDTLTRYAQMAAQAALGRSLSKTEISSFVDQFHSQQVQSYTDAANHNGLSSMKDDPRASAIDFVTNNNSEEFGQHQVQGYTDAFLNMFLNGASAAPSPVMDPQGIGY